MKNTLQQAKNTEDINIIIIIIIIIIIRKIEWTFTVKANRHAIYGVCSKLFWGPGVQCK